MHIHRVLSRALKQAVKLQVCFRNVADAVEKPKPEDKEMLVLNTSEQGSFLKLISDNKLYYPALIGLMTGMRRGEVLALRWREVDLVNNSINVIHSLEQTKSGLRFKPPKTKKSRRSLAISPLLVNELKKLKISQAKQRLALGPAYQDNNLVCCRENGTLLLPSSLSSQFSAFMKTIDLPKIRFQDLRHTHATELFKQGVHPKIVSERLGHSSIVITLTTYSHVLPGMQDDAMASFDNSLLYELNKEK